MTLGVDVVIPTVGRSSLWTLLDALVTPESPVGHIFVVDDRSSSTAPLPVSGVRVLRSGGRGPAAARNVGWHRSSATWVAFLDDDVVPDDDWAARLLEDLEACGEDVGASQGRVTVPLPSGRRPTDWERNVSGLADARWATADMAYRRSLLWALNGFDERFPRAYREDADLGLRAIASGYRITSGSRHVTHPVRPAPWHVSISKQAGNADDALMRRLHGRHWRRLAGAPQGMRSAHAAITAFAAVASVGALTRRPGLAGMGGAAWLGATAALANRRIAPGPRTAAEVATMVATSVAIPPAATAAWCRGWVRAKRIAPNRRRLPRIDGVLFDRDGTLVVDVPYNGDPEQVRLVPGARTAMDRLRQAGVPVGVITNQSGVGRGLLDGDDVAAVNRRIETLLGPVQTWQICRHAPADECECRKPSPALVVAGAAHLGVAPRAVAVIGDIGADVTAARSAGAHGILVPTPATRPVEVATAPHVALDITAAIDLVLRSRRP